MFTWVLPADTLLSTLLPSGGGSLASGDTIDFNGHTLVMDCDAGAYPFTPANAGGVLCKLELRDLSRIELNASLPTTVAPWIDPDNPLPVAAEPGVGGDPYRTPFLANARAQIKVNGTTLGGAAAYLPTLTREGRFWGLANSPAPNQLQFTEEMPLHPGDILVNVSASVMQKLTVQSYDTESKIAIMNENVSARNGSNIWALIAGGVFIQVNIGDTKSVVKSPIIGGTIHFYTTGTTIRNYSLLGPNVSIVARRLTSFPTTSSERSLCGVMAGGALVADQLACNVLVVNDTQYANDNIWSGDIAIIGELVAHNAFPPASRSYPRYVSGHWSIAGGYIKDFGSVYGHAAVCVSETEIANAITEEGPRASVRLKKTTTLNSLIQDTQFETSGTVSRVARSDFPTDTDLPDAFYFAPATASDVPWHYEDHWVRKGETLRLSCRAMRGGDNGAARVAIGEMAVWVPAAGMPTLAEWVLDSGEPLVWRGGQIQWTNDTGEDRQVRVWSMASGINGAYIRVWRATGGAM